MSLLSPPPSKTVQFVPPLAPYGPVANRLHYPSQNFSDGTSQSSTYRCTHTMQESTPFVVLVWVNGASGTANNVGPNPVTYGAAIDHLVGGVAFNSIVPQQVTFGGQSTITVAPGGYAVSDPIMGPFTKGELLLVRSWVSVATLGQKWPVGIILNYGYDGVLAGDQRAAQNFNTTFATTTTGVTPVLILGPTAGRPTVTGCGDSIMDGSGDSSAFPGAAGFLTRACDGVCGLHKLGAPGERVNGILVPQGYARRLVTASHGGNIVSNYGVNDLGNGSSLAQLQSDITTFWRMFSPMRKRVFQTTITPRTNSTDSWATTTNQIVQTWEANRTGFNSWLRAGAPMNSSFVAVSIGTPGALLAGQTGHPLYGVFDVASAVEVNASNVLTLNGGYWQVNGTANYPTTDGTHPSSVLHIAMAAKIDTTKFV